MKVWKARLQPPLSFENPSNCAQVCGKWIKTCEQSVGHAKGCLSNVNKSAAAQARADCLGLATRGSKTACTAAVKAMSGEVGAGINAKATSAKVACRDYQEACIDQCETPVITYAIGDTGPGGGTVFYLNAEGSGGLEAAPEDQGDAAWGCFGTAIPGAAGTAIGTGAENTAAILAECGEAGIAAKLADAYTSPNGTDDWYLPSKDELNELDEQQGVVGGFANDSYWSSSENNSHSVWIHSFYNYGQGIDDKRVVRYGVRAVRAFIH